MDQLPHLHFPLRPSRFSTLETNEATFTKTLGLQLTTFRGIHQAKANLLIEIITFLVGYQFIKLSMSYQNFFARFQFRIKNLEKN